MKCTFQRFETYFLIKCVQRVKIISFTKSSYVRMGGAIQNFDSYNFIEMHFTSNRKVVKKLEPHEY